MAPRIRSLKPDCWQDASLGRVSRDARLLFIGLITQADDEGRMQGDPRLLRAQVFPYDDDVAPDSIDEWLAELEEQGLVRCYAACDDRFVALPGWAGNQKISHPSPSRLPNPPEDSMNAPERSALIGRDRKGKDSSSENGFRREVYELCKLLADEIERNGSKRPNDKSAGWLQDADRLLRLDERDFEEAKRLIRWCQADTFWRSNILSMPKFRAQYDKLRLRATDAGASRPEGDDW